MWLIQWLKDIIAPKICFGCKTKGKFLCQKCFLAQKNYHWFCYICKRDSLNFAIHKKCLIENKILLGKNFNNEKLHINKIIVLSRYSNPLIKRLISHFKFRWKKDIWVELAILLAKHLKKHIAVSATEKENYMLASVPLHWMRKMTRGFNQSDILAYKISQLSHIKYNKHILYRRKITKHQSRLSKEDRLRNLDNAFAIRKQYKGMLQDKTIVLVDDVVSSGTTLNEIAKGLKQNWAKSVIGLTIASN